MKKYDNNKTYVLSGQSLNQIADGINYVNAFRQADSAASMRPYQPGEVMIINKKEDGTPGDKMFSAGDAVVLTKSIFFDNSDKRAYYARFANSSDDDTRPFVITLENIAPGESGKAAASGIAAATKCPSNGSYTAFKLDIQKGYGWLKADSSGWASAVFPYPLWNRSNTYALIVIGGGAGGGGAMLAKIMSGDSQSGYLAKLQSGVNIHDYTIAYYDHPVRVFLPESVYGSHIPVDTVLIVHSTMISMIPDNED